VVAGPAEATALGNVLVQARALGAAPGSLGGMRALLRKGQQLRHFSPSGDQSAWQRAATRVSLPPLTRVRADGSRFRTPTMYRYIDSLRRSYRA